MITSFMTGKCLAERGHVWIVLQCCLLAHRPWTVQRSIRETAASRRFVDLWCHRFIGISSFTLFV